MLIKRDLVPVTGEINVALDSIQRIEVLVNRLKPAVMPASFGDSFVEMILRFRVAHFDTGRLGKGDLSIYSVSIPSFMILQIKYPAIGMSMGINTQI